MNYKENLAGRFVYFIIIRRFYLVDNFMKAAFDQILHYMLFV